MRLQLADNGKSNVSRHERYTYNPVTKVVTFEGAELSAKGRGKARRAAKRTAKAQRRSTKSAAKTARKAARQQGRLGRVMKRQEKRNIKAEKKTERQRKGLIRVRGKQDVIRARQEEKLDKIRQGSYDPEYDTDSDSAYIPDDVNAGGYEVDESQYDDFEYVDEFTPEYESDDDGEYYEFDEFDEPEELSAGIIGGLIKGASNLIKGGAQQGAQAVKRTTSQVDMMRKENYALKQRLESANKNKYLIAGGSFAGGTLIGYLLAKKR